MYNLKKEFIPLDQPIFRGNESKYLADCLKTGWISWQGKYVSNFENKFSKYVNQKYATTTSNGTSALITALKAIGLKKLDEVIVPSLTFSASVFSISATGARPVFVDCLSGRLDVDPKDILKKITKKTKAIMVVHLYGRPVKIDEIIKIARRYNLYVIEDCAECLGATFDNQITGSFGDISCFSFHNKLIATGEGGMITTNNKSLHLKVLDLKNPAPDNRSSKKIISLNSRMSNINAAIGLAQLEQIEDFIKKKRKIVSIYEDFLSNVRGIDLIKEDKNIRSTYWRYSILLNKNFPISREKLIYELRKKKIITRGIFTPMHLHPIYKNKKKQCTESINVSKIGLDIPSSVALDVNDIKYIAKAILHIK
jgi:perosamine synthetase